ncbi:MAG: M23 family metallopeptidase [Alicyclobacillus macrosporangiidus]|uniref:M23 family metallopeptidase n=1 Tax=Alicyclobacillus macrosporangiidus TaxID=392015 RepID=UPI0026F12F87|nr:M23 family metallopeptidase [Alicyclobacillus macrosporangiidus]MCL6599352.1 M23 family metallopeptidase [Alicyclobacillus macrosporangiidus]
MDENKHPNQNLSKENQKGSQAPETPGSAPIASRRVFSKRWVYPAIYLGAAALIIGLMYVKSQTGTSPVTSSDVNEGQGQTTTTTAQALTWQWPADPAAATKVTLGFYPANGTPDQQAAALVSYDNGYYPHQGVDIKAASGQPFTVLAAADGKVTAVNADPNSQGNQLKGLTVVVTSPGGYEEHYESLSAVKVKAGDTVRAGQAIGTSGTCLFEQSQGNHLFFAVYKDGQLIDPATVLPKS